MLESFSIKLHSLRTATLLKKDSSTVFFLCEISKNFKKTFFFYLQWLLLIVYNFIKKETPAKMFFCRFCKKILRSSFDRTSSDYCFCLSVNFKKIFRIKVFHLSYWASLGDCLFHLQTVELYTRTRSSLSKAFICLKSLKIICEEANL